ncbi:hypothetical protein D9611_012460 [Ephemerocybe angulata]|uniref:DUF7330 domain-containing protein n=1 Tax=Ephemerocybe angulata TaxID=980116 RepID=A0A8H5FIT5_9AGAR|nr:hypothetical protein D9611_012460 [Tulosesus angulatus]
MILDHRFSLRKTAAAPMNPAAEKEEKPPPYTQSSYPTYDSNKPLPSPLLTPPPTHPRRQTSHGQLVQAAELKPYPTPTPSASSSRLADPLSPPAAPDPPPTVNQVHLLSKKEDIIGTFYVDPLIPTLNPGKRKKRGKRAASLPHASFQTRSGAIGLSLATTGNVLDSSKADITVASKTGNIEIRLLPTPPTRPRIAVDITSRSGDIMVWLPETFSGVIQLHTKKGELHVLPSLVKVAQVLKSTDKEAMLLMGSGPRGEESSQTDLCQLNSRSGKVIIGLSGKDKHPQETGFWKKLSLFFSG